MPCITVLQCEIVTVFS